VQKQWQTVGNGFGTLRWAGVDLIEEPVGVLTIDQPELVGDAC